jgi:hypothetical protein
MDNFANFKYKLVSRQGAKIKIEESLIFQFHT